MSARTSKVLILRTESEYGLPDRLYRHNRDVIDVLTERDAINAIIQSNPDWVVVSALSDQKSAQRMIDSVRPWFSGRVLNLYGSDKSSDQDYLPFDQINSESPIYKA